MATSSQSSQLDVSDGQASCTRDVQIGEKFELERMKIALVDTPGFDDTVRSDAEILQIIMAFLEALWVFDEYCIRSNLTLYLLEQSRKR